MRRGWAMAAAAAVCALFSCSLVVDTSGLSSGSGSGALDSGPEASVDGSKPDLDAGADVTRDADADAANAPDVIVSGCAGLGAHTLCDDFDTGLLGAKWSRVPQTAGPVTLDVGASVSPPRALSVTIPAGVATDTRASLEKDFATGVHTRVELSFMFDAVSSQSSFDVAFVKVDPPPLSPAFFYALTLAMKGSALWYAEETVSSTTFEKELVSAMAPGTWYRLALDLVTTTNSARGKAFVNGTEIVSRPLSTSPPPGIVVGVGATYVDIAPVTTHIRVDDVVIDSE